MNKDRWWLRHKSDCADTAATAAAAGPAIIRTQKSLVLCPEIFQIQIEVQNGKRINLIAFGLTPTAIKRGAFPICLGLIKFAHTLI